MVQHSREGSCLQGLRCQCSKMSTCRAGDPNVSYSPVGSKQPLIFLKILVTFGKNSQNINVV